MRQLKKTVLFSFLFAASFFAKAQVANADTMVHKLFAALPANDEKAFVALYPSPQQLIDLVKNIMQSDEVKKQIAASGKSVNMDSIVQTTVAAMSKPEVMEQMTKGFGQNFERTVAAGKTKGINWQKARFVSYTVDTASNVSQDDAILLKVGYKTMKGVIDFSVDTAVYQMQFEKMLFIPNTAGWYGGEFGQIVRKGESFGLPNDEMATDSSASVETAPPPTKTKTKTNSSGTKTKTKIKSAARKPATKF